MTIHEVETLESESQLVRQREYVTEQSGEHSTEDWVSRKIEGLDEPVFCISVTPKRQRFVGQHEIIFISSPSNIDLLGILSTPSIILECLRERAAGLEDSTSTMM